MKLLIISLSAIFMALAVILALGISVISSILGPFVEDDRYFEFDEYHYHPDNEL